MQRTDQGVNGSSPAISGEWYRQVLGQYPTGVCVVTADSEEGGPSGMVVGSFTSVSLDPPLIAFYPAKTSTSWPKIAATGSFCVNILAADQDGICSTFSSKAPDKFADVTWRPGPATGSPVIDDVVAWIDCEIERVADAGDHLLVLGRVLHLELDSPRLPLLFFQGGYGRFSPHTMTASDRSGDLGTPLRYVELIRPQMERIAEQEGCRCLAAAHDPEEVVILASAGHARDGVDTTTLVGQRLPHLPPSGSVFAAWAPADEQERWLRNSFGVAREHHRTALTNVRERGYSVGLVSEAQREFASTIQALEQDPSTAWPPLLVGLIPQLSYDPVDLDENLHLVRLISAPVFDSDGEVALALTIFGFQALPNGATPLIESLLDTAAAATRRIGGRVPEPTGVPSG